ncbi:MAG: hypothetical protein EBZ89_14815 [Chloroflexi bacterium]|nr:hypothetical protein [Pseudomonadota bacterium]NDE08637.1 hypothetical protein [Chloroflexota bacterium]
MANPQAMAVTESPDVNASMTACTGEVSSIRKLNGVVAAPGGPRGEVSLLGALAPLPARGL